jgi:tocopherol O-methyltransferase
MIVPSEVADADTVGRHYDDLDIFYRDVWGEHLHHGLWRTGNETPEEAVQLLIAVVAQAADIEAGAEVCDIGCGYGGTSRVLADQYQARVTGYTVSQAQHRYAVDVLQGADNPRYRLCPWEQNDLPDASCDAAISIECLTHVADKSAFFEEVQRVLKSGGRAAMTVWMSEPNPNAWKVHWLLEPICREGRLAGMGAQADYEGLIRDSGLSIDAFENWSRQVRKTWWICARRLLWKLMTSPRYWKALFDRSNGNRIFGVTLVRILVAYYVGAMRYGFVVMSKHCPPGSQPAHEHVER